VPFEARRAEEGCMHYVYLIKSVDFPDQKYIGYTDNLEKRIISHNRGESKHTSKYMPWKLVACHAFLNKDKVMQFEYYLKTGSGQAFANKRFW
jgi:putative endonuclease